MTKEEFIEARASIDKRIDALKKEVDRLREEKRQQAIAYIEENKPFEADCFVEVKGTRKTKTGKERRFHEYAYLKGWGFEDAWNDKFALCPVMENIGKYDHKHDEAWTGMQHYFVSGSRYVSYAKVESIAPVNLPTCTCDTCMWLGAHHKDGELKPHCEIIIGQDLHEFKQAKFCEHWGFWTWSSSEGGITKWEQLQRDNGHASPSEEQARQIFGKVLDDMANEQHKKTNTQS